MSERSTPRVMVLPYGLFAVTTFTRGHGGAWIIAAVIVMISLVGLGALAQSIGKIENPRAYWVTVAIAAVLLCLTRWPDIRAYGFAACSVIAGIFGMFPIDWHRDKPTSLMNSPRE